MQTFKPQITAAVRDQDQGAVDKILTDPDVTDPFFSELTGTIEDPGTITQFSLAGMAAGDNALDTGAAANPHNFNPSNRATGLNVSWTVLSVEALEFAREHAGEMVTNINETTRKLVNAIIVRLIEDDTYGPGDAIRDLDDIFDDTARARNIAINESTIAYNKGVDKRWAASGVVVAAVWQTVRDQFVDAVCRGLHGQTAAIGESFVHKGGGDEDQQELRGTTYETPPAHIGCRCFKRPVTIPLREVQPSALDDAVKAGGVPPVFGDTDVELKDLVPVEYGGSPDGDSIIDLFADIFDDEDEELASEFIENIQFWSFNGYLDIRRDQISGTKSDEADSIEAGLSVLPRHKGEIFRVINIASLDQLQGGVAEIGEIFQTRALTSFTQDLEALINAPEFDEINDKSTIFRVKENRAGVAIDEISSTEEEMEVLVPSQTAYRIDAITERINEDSDSELFGQGGWVIDLVEIQ